MRDNENIQHMMFPVGPGHWYWVKISKGQPFTVEVYDPYNLNVNHIFQFLKPHLTAIGIESYTQNHEKFQIPQKDGYACGYFVAAKANELMRQLAPDLERLYNQQVINALVTQGNANNILRDCFIDQYANTQDPAQVASSQVESQTKLSSESLTHIADIINQHARSIEQKHQETYKINLHSLFAIKDKIEEQATIFQALRNTNEELTDDQLACILQAEAFRTLKP